MPTNTLTELVGATAAPVTRRDVARVVKMVRSGLRSHGRDVELVDVQGHDVTVRLIGAPEHGRLSFTEGSGVLERVIKSRIPDVRVLTVVR